ncbi:MAG: FAD-dependent oxidoreductase [Thermodesulfobacteriota bacterium]|nr:FAD-dependent oxidoreductase [Thermodesulfobacteriota bacterium]
MRLIIVGGVAGGATAAARARRLCEDAEIILFERGEYVSYANCGLPYYIGRKIKERDELFVTTPERLERRYRIDVRTCQEVVHIDPEQKTVQVRNLETDEVVVEPYDRLILAPGARAMKPPIPGIDQGNIFHLKDVNDTDRVKAFVSGHSVASALIVGGGFIGLETAENLARLGIAVTVVEMLPQLLPQLDYDMAVHVHQHLREQKVKLILGQAVKRFDHQAGRITAVTDRDTDIHVDMVIVSAGIQPERELAEGAGLTIGETGGIYVDEHMNTSDGTIWAVGDAIETTDFVSGRKTRIPLAGPANRQGRAAADNAMGRKDALGGLLGTSIVKTFDIVAASTGMTEKCLKDEGLPYRTSFTHSLHHAGYYPDATMVSIKLLFAPDTGKILGAQVTGKNGVDKRIDVLAVAIYAGMTVYDLQELQLAYAPQFGSAKDAVNIAGYVAANMLKGDVQVRHWHELEQMDSHDYLLLDVRSTMEVRKEGVIPGAQNIDIDELRDHLDELDKTKTIIAYCTVSMRAYLACRILTQKGFRASILSGGWMTWLPIQQDREAQQQP